ncbi:MAG: VOC family protein [Oscillospiraceae bacterium]|jgi:lactoylglutathione lyase|nr:VOC family protein [Oscillospiraceae bacterium]
MSFKFVHSNRNVADLEKSVAFYQEALGLKEVRRKEAEDGSFTLVFLEASKSGKFQLELTWLRDWKGPYDLGDNELHLAVTTADIEKARQRHEAMGCVCYDNPGMGVYFISDPDGYWTEIIPEK